MRIPTKLDIDTSIDAKDARESKYSKDKCIAISKDQKHSFSLHKIPDDSKCLYTSLGWEPHRIHCAIIRESRKHPKLRRLLLNEMLEDFLDSNGRKLFILSKSDQERFKQLIAATDLENPDTKKLEPFFLEQAIFEGYLEGRMDPGYWGFCSASGKGLISIAAEISQKAIIIYQPISEQKKELRGFYLYRPSIVRSLGVGLFHESTKHYDQLILDDQKKFCEDMQINLIDEDAEQKQSHLRDQQLIAQKIQEYKKQQESKSVAEAKDLSLITTSADVPINFASLYKTAFNKEGLITDRNAILEKLIQYKKYHLVFGICKKIESDSAANSETYSLQLKAQLLNIKAQLEEKDCAFTIFEIIGNLKSIIRFNRDCVGAYHLLANAYFKDRQYLQAIHYSKWAIDLYNEQVIAGSDLVPQLIECQQLLANSISQFNSERERDLAQSKAIAEVRKQPLPVSVQLNLERGCVVQFVLDQNYDPVWEPYVQVLKKYSNSKSPEATAAFQRLIDEFERLKQFQELTGEQTAMLAYFYFNHGRIEYWNLNFKKAIQNYEIIQRLIMRADFPTEWHIYMPLLMTFAYISMKDYPGALQQFKTIVGDPLITDYIFNFYFNQLPRELIPSHLSALEPFRAKSGLRSASQLTHKRKRDEKSLESMDVPKKHMGILTSGTVISSLPYQGVYNAAMECFNKEEFSETIDLCNGILETLEDSIEPSDIKLKIAFFILRASTNHRVAGIEMLSASSFGGDVRISLNNLINARNDYVRALQHMKLIPDESAEKMMNIENSIRKVSELICEMQKNMHIDLFDEQKMDQVDDDSGKDIYISPEILMALNSILTGQVAIQRPIHPIQRPIFASNVRDLMVLGSGSSGRSSLAGSGSSGSASSSTADESKASQTTQAQNPQSDKDMVDDIDKNYSI